MSQIAFWGAVELGLVFAFVAIGVYLAFRVLDFPDLTVDGSFPLGAAVAAVMIIAGLNAWVATAIAMVAGAGGTASVTNGGTITSYADVTAYGVFATAKYDGTYVNVANSGSIYAGAAYYAIGIRAGNSDVKYNEAVAVTVSTSGVTTWARALLPAEPPGEATTA